MFEFQLILLLLKNLSLRIKMIMELVKMLLWLRRLGRSIGLIYNMKSDNH